jgi:RNA polymerase sigma factor (sigma-70 family)
MVSPQVGTFARELQRLAGAQAARELPDAQLLQRFALRREEEAFAALVGRHGPLVWGVCRRLARHEQDAENAFQAVFLALARRAGSIRQGESLGGWLYQAAYRTARRARSQRAQRERHECRAAAHGQSAESDLAWRELQGMLDEELGRLPRKYREPFVLCCLEGRGRREAATELGWKEGTVSSRIAQARRLLQARLARRGVALSAALTAGELWRQSAFASLPLGLARRVVGVAVGQVAVPAAVAALAHGTAARLLAMVLAMLAGLAAAVSLAVSYPAPGKPGGPEEGEAVAAEQPAVDAHGDPLPPGAVARLGTARFRPGGHAHWLHFTPDGKRLVSLDDYGVTVWDAASGRPVVRQRFAKPGLGYYAFLPRDGGSVVTAEWRTWGGTYGVRRRTTSDFRVQGEFATGLRTGRDKVMGLSPDGKLLVGAVQHHMEDYSIEFWDVEQGKKVRSWHAHPGEVHCIAFSADGKTLVTGGADKAVRAWDVATGAKRLEITRFPLQVGQVAVSDDGRTVAYVGTVEKDMGLGNGQRVSFSDNHAYLWDVPSRKATHHLEIPAIPPRGLVYVPGFSALRFSPDGKTLFTAGGDELLRFWDVKEGRQLRQMPLGFVGAGRCDFSPDGKTLAVGTTAIHLIDVATCKEVVKAPGPLHAVHGVIVTPDARTAVTLGDGAVTLWDAKSGRLRGKISEPSMRLWSPHLLRDGRTLLYQDEANALRWLDLPARKETRRDPRGKDFWSVLAVSPDGKTAAACDADGKGLSLIELGTGRAVGRLSSPAGRYNGAAFAPDGRTLLTWSSGHMVHLWDLKTHKCVRDFSLAEPPPQDPSAPAAPGSGNWRDWNYTAVLSPTGHRIASSSACGYLAVHDVATGKAVRVVGGLPEGTSCFAFSPDGRMLGWAGGREPVVRVFEIASGKERLKLEGHAGQIRSLVFSADGRTLVSGSEDTTALVWDVLGGPGATVSLEACWADLADADAARAFRAVRRLLQSPAEAAALIGSRMRPVPVVEGERLKALIADLDSDNFTKRQDAAAGLEKLGDAAAGAIREAIPGAASPEKRRRLERLLRPLDAQATDPTPGRLRLSRCLEVLERVGTPEARSVLEVLAGGAAGAWLTQQAKEALARRPAR